MKTLLLALLVAGSLSACVVEPAHVRVRSPIVLEPGVIAGPAYGEPHHHWHENGNND